MRSLIRRKWQALKDWAPGFKVNGVRHFMYFHHYFELPDRTGLYPYNLAVGWQNLTIGVHWCPWSGGSTRRHPYGGHGYHIWVSVPFVSLMLEWRSR